MYYNEPQKVVVWIILHTKPPFKDQKESKGYSIKVSKFEKQTFLFSLEPKNKRNYFLNSALACKMSLIKILRLFIILYNQGVFKVQLF